MQTYLAGFDGLVSDLVNGLRNNKLTVHPQARHYNDMWSLEPL